MIDVLRTKTPEQVRRAVSGFAEKYVLDWDRWLAAKTSDRPAMFVKTLGKWQAVRPNRLRRLSRRGDEHPPPYIENLLEAAAPHVQVLAPFFVGLATGATLQERTALSALWTVFSELPQCGHGSCVAVTKAVLLLSRDKYKDAIQTAKGHMEGAAEERDGKLYFKGTTKTQAEANKIWDAIKTVPEWANEIVADIKATGGGDGATADRTYTVTRTVLGCRVRRGQPDRHHSSTTTEGLFHYTASTPPACLSHQGDFSRWARDSPARRPPAHHTTEGMFPASRSET